MILNKSALGLFLILFLTAAPLQFHSSWAQSFTVWNVGQGQWTSLIEDSTCLHVDVGGEKAPWRQIQQACGTKNNQFWISHWDHDHFGFLGKKTFARIFTAVSRICIHWPSASPGTQKKLRVKNLWPACKRDQSSIVEEIYQGQDPRKTNEQSRVLTLSKRILLPGDSPEREEKKWRTRVPGTIDLFVLGHHGSKTSSSELLLRSLAKPKMAIASARRAKYGHPHALVRERLRQHGIPLLLTEKWGNLHFEMKNK